MTFKKYINVFLVGSMIYSSICISSALATYNAGITGKIDKILTYSDGHFYIKLENQPTSHPICAPEYFSHDQNISESAKDRLYSRALLAYQTGVEIYIGYDDGLSGTAECGSGSKIIIFRIG